MRELRVTDPLPRGLTLVEASAGTGKTWTLTAMVLRLLLEHGLPIEHILVVTYTDAATAELRERLRLRLVEAAALLDGGVGEDPLLTGLVDGWDDEERGLARQRVTAALLDFDAAAVFTIHGFCSHALREHAFESGVPFDVELGDARDLVDEVVGDFWTRQLHDLPGELLERITTGRDRVTLEQLTTLARAVVGRREAAVVPPPGVLSPEPRDPLDLRLRLVAWARAEVTARAAARGRLSFDDLLHELAAALAGPDGPALRTRLSQRYRAILIDEFQDTDPVQYRIFSQVFTAGDGWLVTIGDPKQAIYGFRGADIHAYLRAAEDAGERRVTLGRNHRSDARLVEALDRVYSSHPSPFLDPRLAFVSVSAQHIEPRLTGPGGPLPALRVLLVDPGEARLTREHRITKGWATQELHHRVAADVAAFLESGTEIEGRPVSPGDVAVLVRKNWLAAAVQEALRALRIPAVRYGNTSVFTTPSADDLRAILAAIADPADPGRVRAALFTPTLGGSAADLASLEEDEERWEQEVETLRELGRIWKDRGFIQSFRALMAVDGLQTRVLSRPDGERRMTDLLHLGEIAQRAVREESLSPAGLLRWLAAPRHGDKDVDQVRLESDARCVQVVTVHKSKGLQYPVVWVPYAWEAAKIHPRELAALRFHDPDAGDRLTLDLGSPDQPRHQALAEDEALAEALRLLYVALTRAEHQVTLVHGLFNEIRSSPLSYLLHARDGGLDGLPRARATLLGLSAGDVRRRIDELVGASGGTIAREPLPPRRTRAWHGAEREPVELSVRRLRRPVDTHWRTSSFSALTDDDDHDDAPTLPAEREGEARVPLADFPRGARAGTFLHAVLELADFQDPDSVAHHTRELLPAHGFDPELAHDVAAGLLQALQAPVLPDGARLVDIPRRERLDELEFLVPVASRVDQGQLGLFRAPERVLPRTLARVLAHHASDAVPPDYPARVSALGFAPLQGFLRGFVDLVFRWQGQWHVVDYKSNSLGAHAADYTVPAMTEAMASHHYFLQYHLYAVALHRYLRLRIPRYDPRQHLGGAAYLFLRGMGPGSDHGVFRDPLPAEVVLALDAALEGR